MSKTTQQIIEEIEGLKKTEEIVAVVQLNEERWREEFITTYKLCLSKSSIMVIALNDREAVRKNNAKFNTFTTENLENILTEISNKNTNPQYTIDRDRTHGELKNPVLTEAELELISPIDKLRYSSAIFYSIPHEISELSGTALNAAKEPEKIIDYFRVLKDNLTALARKLIINDQLQNAQSNPNRRYTLLRTLLQGELQKPDLHPDLKKLGSNILKETQQLKRLRGLSVTECNKTLDVAYQALTKRDLPSVTACTKQAKHLGEVLKQRKLAGLLMKIAGVVLILACIAVALYSFGALTPLSFLGITLGASLITGYSAVGVGVVGLGIVGGGFFCSTKKLESSLAQLPTKINEVTQDIAESSTPV